MKEANVISVDGIFVEYVYHNSEYVNLLPTLVFFHGTPGDCGHCEIYCDEIIKQKYPVLSWSRTGYGQSAFVPHGSSFKRQARMLKGLLDRLGIDRILGYGVSGGTPVLLEFCTAYKNTVQAAIVESSVVGSYVAPNRTLYQKISDSLLLSATGIWVYSVLFRLFPNLVNLLAVYRYSNLSFRGSFYESKYLTGNKKIAERIEKLIGGFKNSRSIVKGYSNDIKELAQDRRVLVSNLPDSLLILHGTDDSEVAMAESDYIKTVKPSGEYVEIYNGSHVLPISSRHIYADTVKLEFIKNKMNRS